MRREAAVIFIFALLVLLIALAAAAPDDTERAFAGGADPAVAATATAPAKHSTLKSIGKGILMVAPLALLAL